MKIATIGSNKIVDSFAAAVQDVPGMEISVVWSRTEAQARRNLEKWNARLALWNWQDLLDTPEADAVYIASPNTCHFRQAKDLLLAGKHVLLEKPACMTAEEFRVLAEIAEEKHLTLMEAMRPAHLPILSQLRELMEELGEIRYADFPYCQYSSRYDKFRNGIVENAFDPALGGGALTDIGVYSVAWMEQLLGMPEKITADTVRLPGSIDGVTVLQCVYPGCIAVVSGSKIHNAYRPCVLEGEKASLELRPFPIPTEATLRFPDGSTRVIPLVIEKKDMIHELKDFLSAAEGRTDPAGSIRHTINVLEILDRAKAQITPKEAAL